MLCNVSIMSRIFWSFLTNHFSKSFLFFADNYKGIIPRNAKFHVMVMFRNVVQCLDNVKNILVLSNLSLLRSHVSLAGLIFKEFMKKFDQDFSCFINFVIIKTVVYSVENVDVILAVQEASENIA